MNATEWAPDACAECWHLLDRVALDDVMCTPDPSDPVFPVITARVVAVFPTHAVARVVRGSRRLPVDSFVALILPAEA